MTHDLVLLISHAASSDLESSNVSISYSRIIRKYISNNVFFDAGIGVSFHNNESMNGSDLGSVYQFENRFGIGYERETYRSVLNIFHYSNGGLEDEERRCRYIDVICF